MDPVLSRTGSISRYGDCLLARKKLRRGLAAGGCASRRGHILEALTLAGILALAAMIAGLAVRLALAGIHAIAMDRTSGRCGGSGRGADRGKREEGGGRSQSDGFNVVHGNVSVAAVVPADRVSSGSL